MSAGDRDRSLADYDFDHLIEVISSLAIAYIATGSEASSRGLRQSLERFGGGVAPVILQCPSNEVAVALARGYGNAARVPMAVIIDQGLDFETATTAIAAARRDLVPLLVFGIEQPSDRAAALSDPDPQSLGRAVEILVQADRPIIVADLVGRNPLAVPSLVALAEALGAPVIDQGGRFNMPSVHPLDATNFAEEALRSADVVLLLDVLEPYQALSGDRRETRDALSISGSGRKVVSISAVDPLIASAPVNHAEPLLLDVSIVTDTAVAIPLLLADIRAYLMSDEEMRDRASERGAIWADDHRGRRAAWRREASEEAQRSPLMIAAVAQIVWDAIKDQNWTLAGGNLGGWPRRLWDFRQPLQYVGSRVRGQGLAAAVGVALAARGTGRLTIDLESMVNAASIGGGLEIAGGLRLPLLSIICRDNSSGGIGADDHTLDFAALARASGLHGEGPITRGEGLRAAIERSVKVLKDEGMTAVIDVVCEAG